MNGANKCNCNFEALGLASILHSETPDISDISKYLVVISHLLRFQIKKLIKKRKK